MAWVATAPTPLLIQGTRAPRAKNLEAAAMPKAPVVLSWAIIDQVTFFSPQQFSGSTFGQNDAMVQADPTRSKNMVQRTDPGII